VEHAFNRQVQLVCAWLGVPFIALFFVALIVAGYLPPISPAAPPEEVGKFFADNGNWIRFGMLIGTLGAALSLPMQAAVAMQMRRAEGAPGVLTMVWIFAAPLFCIEIIYPMMWWMVAAYRPDGNPEITQRFNDLAWLSFLGVVNTAVAQAVALGFVVLRDRRSTPVYPRWFGYFCFWSGALLEPAGIIVFFKRGAFAWNGAFSWWTVVTIFGLWVGVTIALTIRAIRSEPDDPAVVDVRVQVDELRAEIAAIREDRLLTSDEPSR
jgi:hypothetical protein